MCFENHRLLTKRVDFYMILATEGKNDASKPVYGSVETILLIKRANFNKIGFALFNKMLTND